nr:MAG TPA: hypothetical protein [Caudoviricetes sp.]
MRSFRNVENKGFKKKEKNCEVLGSRKYGK